MAKHPEAEPKEPKAKQSRLAGFEPCEIQEVREAAEAFSEVKDEFVALTPKLTKAKEDLHAVMRKHKVKKCRAGDLLCEIIPGEEDVKVKRVRAGTDEE